jgi:two-component system sensor histidine kinase YesM
MLERIDHLVNSVFIGEINRNKLEVEKKEAELIALRNQINPHFLFNTLETVRMNLISINDQENASIVKLIADNFRISLANKKDTYTLKDELRFVDNYVKIQRYRFKDKITFTKKIPTDLLKLPIPELIIQPLIENSFYHGLEKKIENGSVVLEILIENNRVFITVTDDGVGMSESKKNELNNLITNTQTLQVDIRTRRMALRNIYSRLFRMYESELTFAIKSESNVGTEIAISFPIQIGELS